MGASVPFLRLVPSGTADSRAAHPATEVNQHGFELSATKPVALALRKGAIEQLLLSLVEGESIDFVHERTQPTAAGAAEPRPYRFTAVARSNRDDHAGLASRVQTSLRVANDIWSFTPSAPGVNARAALTHAWQVQLCPVRALHLPGHNEEASHNPRNNDDQFDLPCPTALPAWTLSSLLNEDLGLPACTRISIRFAPRRLDHAAARKLAYVRHRIQSGELALFAAGSPLANYSASREINEPVCELIGMWLRNPAGYAVDMLIEASGAIEDLAIRRLTLDFAGNAPVIVHPIAAQDVCRAELPQQPCSWLHHSQALPGVFPDTRLVLPLGIPRLFHQPANLPPPDTGIAIGMTACGPLSRAVHLPDADRTSHLSIFGSSGSGKSTLLLQLAAQDMAAMDGRGTGLIDPHGTLYRDVLELVPKRRRADVICIDVDDLDHVASVNPLEGTKSNLQKSIFVSNEIVSLIDTLFEGQDTSGPTGRAHIRNALQLVAWMPDREGTFLDALRLFEEHDFLRFLLSKCANRALVAHFEKFKSSNGDHGFANWMPYLIPRLSPFCSSPAMRRMLSRPKSTVNISEAVARGKILLVNLNSAALGSTESRIFGNLIMNQIFFAAMNHGPKQGTSRKPFHLIVDEAASMVSENMLPIWAQCRKYGLSLTTANQSTGQLRNRMGAATIADGIIANTASKLMFRLGSDTERLQPYFRSAFSDTDMVELPVFHAVANIVCRGQPIPPFVLRVARPVRDDAVHASMAECIDSSNRSNAEPTAVVVQELCRTFDLNAADVDVERRQRCEPADGDTAQSESRADAERPVPVGAAFRRAMSMAMHRSPGMRYPEELARIASGAYVSTSAIELPSYPSVREAVERDSTVPPPTKARLLKALAEIRTQFWLPESESEAAVAAT